MDVLGRAFLQVLTPLVAASPSVAVQQAMGCLVAAFGQGAVCVDLAMWAEKRLPDGSIAPAWPVWREDLLGSGLVGVAPAFMPLLLVDSRLYFARYWALEQQVACDIARRAREVMAVDELRLAVDLAQLFPANGQQRVDGQKLAAATAVLCGVAVISGGPGTGKTTTVLRLLVALLRQQPTLRIHLCAPTGKAAARLRAALSQQAQVLYEQGLLKADECAALPVVTSTVHRLLGMGESGMPRHHATAPLLCDVLVVDEASMLDLALFAKLCAALPVQTRLILLGDDAQLAAVEVGAVFAALCQVKVAGEDWWHKIARLMGVKRSELPPAVAAAAALPLAGAVVHLTHSYRFAAEAGIGQLAQAVLRGDVVAMWAVLQHPACTQQLAWREHGSKMGSGQWVKSQYAPYWEAVKAFVAAGVCDEVTVAAVFAAWEQFALLCPQYEGDYGIRACNALFDHGKETWYCGRAVLVTRNDYPLQVFNGDVGLVLPDARAGGALRVFFAHGTGFRTLHPARLPAHQSAFALSVHKSQGSEFARVAVFLPEKATPFLDRRVLYTAITRAKAQVTLVGSATVLEAMVRAQAVVPLGLADLLQ